MAEKYGKPGNTDKDGFDPYRDSVGAGIYSGTIERDRLGDPVIGQQYQNHNDRPGPIHGGGGYTPVSRAIASFVSEGELPPARRNLGQLVKQYPDLVNDVSTGGASPLHTCGMSQTNQHATAFLIAQGGDIEALDTYGFTPLHRMASNNLVVGARALLDAGADPNGLAGLGLVERGHTPMQIARQSRATAVIDLLVEYGSRRQISAKTKVSLVKVANAGFPDVIGTYEARSGEEIPAEFSTVCTRNGWSPDETWRKLNGGEDGTWFAHTENDSYLYYNEGDKHWWIDGPDGLGAYKARGPPWSPPAASTQWQSLRHDTEMRPGPTLIVHRGTKQ